MVWRSRKSPRSIESLLFIKADAFENRASMATGCSAGLHVRFCLRANHFSCTPSHTGGTLPTRRFG